MSDRCQWYLKLATGCVFAFSLSIATIFGPVSSRYRAHNDCSEVTPIHRPKAGTLSAEKNDASLPSLDNTSLAFVVGIQEKAQQFRGGLRDGFLRALGLVDLLFPSAIKDKSWGMQIMNTTNIRRENMTVEAVADTWQRMISGEDGGDATDHVWCDFIGDWSKVRQSKILMAGVRAVCIAVLTWGFCESVLTSLSISGIRMWTAMRQQSFVMRWYLFLHVSPEHRQVVLNAYGILKVRFELLFFALKVRTTGCLLKHQGCIVLLT